MTEDLVPIDSTILNRLLLDSARETANNTIDKYEATAFHALVEYMDECFKFISKMPAKSRHAPIATLPACK